MSQKPFKMKGATHAAAWFDETLSMESQAYYDRLKTEDAQTCENVASLNNQRKDYGTNRSVSKLRSSIAVSLGSSKRPEVWGKHETEEFWVNKATDALSKWQKLEGLEREDASRSAVGGGSIGDGSVGDNSAGGRVLKGPGNPQNSCGSNSPLDTSSRSHQPEDANRESAGGGSVDGGSLGGSAMPRPGGPQKCRRSE